jgi:nucleoside 2-deoxyribosyltransferase
MKLTVCGSMKFASEMVAVEKHLAAYGIEVILPDQAEHYVSDPSLKALVSQGTIGAQRKIDHDFIRKHYEEIVRSDAILILNYDKNGIRNYVGGNTFLEMGFAYILRKPIYLLNPPSEEQVTFYQELVAMQPIVLEGDATKITHYL